MGSTCVDMDLRRTLSGVNARQLDGNLGATQERGDFSHRKMRKTFDIKVPYFVLENLICGINVPYLPFGNPEISTSMGRAHHLGTLRSPLPSAVPAIWEKLRC